MAISVADKNFLVSLYVGYFNRAPDPAGLQYWIEQVEGGRDTNTIAADFATSSEAKALYPFLTTPDVSSPTAFITSVYQNLFNRAPDAAGLAFWEGQLSSGTVSASDMIDAIIKGAVTAPDSTIMNNKVEVGLDFATDAGNTAGFTYNDVAATAATTAISGVTDDAATVAAAKSTTDAFFAGGGSGTSATTHTLTTGADALSGGTGIDKFIGTETTLSSADALDGGAGNDTLKYASSGTAAVSEAGFTAANIEMLDITADAVGGTTFDVTGVSDAKTITNSNSSANLSLVGGENIVDLELKDVSGGNTTVTYQASAVAGTTDVQNVTLNDVHSNAGAAVSTLTVNGVETVNITTAGGASLLTDIATGAKTVNVAGDQDLGITNAIAGATKIDASALTGNLTIKADSAGIAKDVAVTGGAGDDTADFSNGFEADDSFDGGAGTDTLGLTNAVATGSPAGTTSNVEQLNITSVGTGTIDMDNFAGVNKVIYDAGIAAFGTATVDDAVTGTTVEVDVVTPGTSIVVDLKTDGTADELTVALDEIAAGDTLTSVNAADAETLNISADDDTADGSGTLTITSLTASDATTLKLSGDADLTIGSTVDPATAVLATVDASTATGKVSISGTDFAAGGATVTLGASDDTLNLATAAGADTITLGEGKDTVVYSGPTVAQSSATKVDTITDFKSGTDVVNVTNLMSAGASSTDFVGVFNSFGAAQGAITNGGNIQAVFQSDTNTLWVDANNDGTLNSNDLQIKLDGVSTITAADLGLSGGNVINLTAPGAVVNATTKTNADNMSTNGNDTINAEFAELAGSLVNAGNGTDTFVVTDAVTGAATFSNASAGNVEALTLSKGGAGLVAITSSTLSDVTVSEGDSNVAYANGLGNAAGDDVDYAGGAGSDTLTLQGITYNGNTSFDGNGASDTLNVVAGTNIANATVSDFEVLNIANNATVTMTAAQNNAFTSLVGAAGNESIVLTGAGDVTGNALIENYTLSSSANTFTVNAAQAGVNLAESGASDQTVNIGGNAVTGNFQGFDGGAGGDILVATSGANISGAQGNGGGAGSALGFGVLNLTGNMALTALQHGNFATINGSGINTLTLTTGLTGTTVTSVENYQLAAANDDVTQGSANTAIDGNAGNDVVRVSGTQGGVTLNGGSSTGGANALTDNNDTLVLANGTNIDPAFVTGFEQLGLADGGTFTMDAGQFNTFANALSGNAAFDASGAETLNIASTINDDNTGTLAQAVENFVLQSTGNDVFSVIDVTTEAPSIDIAAGGSDTIGINNAALTAVSNAVVITGFDVANDELRLSDGGTAHNSGFETVTTTDANIVTGADGVIEIASSVTQFLNPTDVANAGSVETALVNAIGTIADGTFSVVGYGNGNAYLYQVEMTDAGADNDLTLATEIDVELVGQINGVAADSLDGFHFA